MRSPYSMTRKGTSSVSELLAPLRLRSGATTVTSASGRNATARHSRPSARYPSSLLTSILKRGTVPIPGPHGRGWAESAAQLYWNPRKRRKQSTPSRTMTDEDVNAFRKAMAGVKPLTTAATPPAAPKPRAIARFSRSSGPAALSEGRRPSLDPRLHDTGDVIAFKRPGVRDDALRRLRRGEITVEAEIDLHGLSRHATHDALRSFLGMALAQRLQCVRVIHGKGLRSGPGGPVLKHAVSDWLARIDSVAAFATARPADGGTGALYVLLRLPA